MDKRASLRQFYTDQDNQKKSDSQHELQLKKLDAVSNDIVSAIGVLIRFLDGKTSKTEVVNQLKSISTPDVDKVVQAISTLDKDILANKLDLKPLVDELRSVKRELTLVPGKIKTPEQKDSVKVTNLNEVNLNTKDLEKAIKNLKLDPKIEVKPADVNIAPVDLKPLKDGLLDVLKAIKAQKYPEFPTIEPTDLTNVEKKLDESNKHLKKIVDKPMGGGGGGGNGTPYVDNTGRPVNVEVETDGSIPVTVVAGGSAGTANLNTRVDKATTDIIYIGKAALGTATSTAGWQIKKIDKTVTDNVTITFAAAGAFSATWNNRGSEVYS
jgi:hypothetical protein